MTDSRKSWRLSAIVAIGLQSMFGHKQSHVYDRLTGALLRRPLSDLHMCLQNRLGGHLLLHNFDFLTP